jgi:hypothetical protein
MNYKDGFLTIMGDMVPTQLGYAPNEPSGVSASDWFESYCGCEKISEALTEIEDDARAIFAAAEAGDLGDDYDSLDDVERDGIMRARIFEDGTVHLYDTDSETHLSRYGEDPSIEKWEEPVDRMSMASICADFGMDPFFPPAGFDAGEHKSIVRFSIIDDEEFRENFLSDFSGDGGVREIEEADLSGFFQPMSGGDLGGTLKSVTIGSGATDAQGNPTWIATLTVDVTNANLLVMKAAEAGRNSGRDSDYVPENVGDAIFESWFGSNDSASPVDYGLEIIEWGPEVEAPEQQDNTPGF